MSVDCGACFAKYLLCLFNFVFFIGGSAVLCIGIWIAADKSSFIHATKILESTNVVEGFQIEELTQPNVIEQFGYVLITVGAFVFLVSFLGYCGALRESRCLLACYGISLIIILVIEITAAGIVLGYKDKVETEVKKALKYTIKEQYKTPEKADLTTVGWNHFMIQLKCCGVDNYHDFADSVFSKEGNQKVPKACCVLVDNNSSSTNKLQPMDPQCTSYPTTANSYFMKGCYDTVVNLILANSNVAIGVVIGLGLIQLLGIFFAFCLCKSIAKFLK